MPLLTLTGPNVTQAVANRMMTVDGCKSHAVAINGTVHAPPIRPRREPHARVSGTNTMAEDTSIH